MNEVRDIFVIMSQGDGTVTRASAVMDERVGNEEWTPYVQTPIKWANVMFLFSDHLGITMDPTFSDNGDSIDLFNPEIWREYTLGLMNPDQEYMLKILLPDVKDKEERKKIALSCTSHSKLFGTTNNLRSDSGVTSIWLSRMKSSRPKSAPSKNWQLKKSAISWSINLNICSDPRRM